MSSNGFKGHCIWYSDSSSIDATINDAHHQVCSSVILAILVRNQLITTLSLVLNLYRWSWEGTVIPEGNDFFFIASCDKRDCLLRYLYVGERLKNQILHQWTDKCARRETDGHWWNSCSCYIIYDVFLWIRSFSADGHRQSIPSEANQSTGAIHHGVWRTERSSQLLSGRNAWAEHYQTTSNVCDYDLGRHSLHRLCSSITTSLSWPMSPFICGLVAYMSQ